MNKKKVVKVLHYIGSLNVGGAQTMLINLYKKIDRSKIQIDIIIDHADETFYKSELEKYGAKIYVLKNINEIGLKEFIKQWNLFFDSHINYDIFHSHIRSVSSIVLKIAKQNGLVTICHSHSTSNGKGIKSLIKKILQINITKNADYLFACSYDSAKWLYGTKKSKESNCIILNNSIDAFEYKYDLNMRHKLRNELNLKEKIVIGQVGRIEKMKNHIFSIKIIEELKKQNDNYVLVIVGDGSLKEELIDYVNKNNLKNNVIFLGNRTDINKYMQLFDIFIMPSLYEGLPLALVEAQAASLPCLISKNIKSGILINEIIFSFSLNDNIDTWISCIKKIFNLPRKNRIKEIVNAGFDSTTNAKWLEKFYINITNNNESGFENESDV